MTSLRPLHQVRPSPTPFGLAERQLAAVEAWHVQRRIQRDASAVGQRSREQRLDLARRMDVLREQHRAIIARTDAQLRSGADLLWSVRPRVLVVHRNEWFADKVGSALADRGAEVIGRLANGAEAVGVAVAELPELLLIEDTLPMLGGEDVVREVLSYAPRSLIVGQVAYDEGIAAMLDAGARAVYARRVPPADVAAGLVALWERTPA